MFAIVYITLGCYNVLCKIMIFTLEQFGQSWKKTNSSLSENG